MIPFLHSSVVGVDFHDGLLQLVEVKARGKQLELLAFNRLELPAGVIVDGRIKDEEQLKVGVTHLLQNANPRPVSGNKMVLVLPSKHVFTHIFRFPASFSLKDIRKALVFEVETVIPFSIEDMIWDCYVLNGADSNAEGGSQSVFFSGVPRSIADEYVHFLESIGIRPRLFAIHADTLTAALESDLTEENTLVLELDPYASNYLIMKGKVLRYYLSVADGSQWMGEGLKNPMDPEFQTKLSGFIMERIMQTQKIIEEQEGDTQLGPINQIFLTGEYAHVAPFFDKLTEAFPGKKVMVGDPKRQLTVDNRRFWEEYQKHGGVIPYSVFFVDALGVARQYLFKRQGSNLLPETLKKTFFFEKIQALIVVISVFMTVALLCAATYLFFLHGQLLHRQDVLAIEMKRVENTLFGTRYQEIKSQLTQFNNEINQLSQIDNALFSVPATLVAVLGDLPSGIELTGYSYDDAALSLKIAGVAKKREQLLLLQDQLKALPFVKNVLAPLSNYDEKENVSFSIELTLSFAELPTYYGTGDAS